MLRALLITAILFATDAVAGEIVWRSPTTGLLPAISDSAPTTEPEQPAFEIYYDPVSVSAGTSVVIKPVGDVLEYTFSPDQSLPPGLILDSKTGKIIGIAAVAGNHNITVRAAKDDFYADLVLSLTIS